MGSCKNSPSPLYSQPAEFQNLFDEKNAKIMKQFHLYESYASTYDVEISTSFNLEPHF